MTGSIGLFTIVIVRMTAVSHRMTALSPSIATATHRMTALCGYLIAHRSAIAFLYSDAPATGDTHPPHHLHELPILHVALQLTTTAGPLREEILDLQRA